MNDDALPDEGARETGRTNGVSSIIPLGAMTVPWNGAPSTAPCEPSTPTITFGCPLFFDEGATHRETILHIDHDGGCLRSSDALL